jgi:hypothetical protein
MSFPLTRIEEIAVVHLVEKWCENPKAIKVNRNDARVLKILNSIFKNNQDNIKKQKAIVSHAQQV